MGYNAVGEDYGGVIWSVSYPPRTTHNLMVERPRVCDVDGAFVFHDLVLLVRQMIPMNDVVLWCEWRSMLSDTLSVGIQIPEVQEWGASMREQGDENQDKPWRVKNQWRNVLSDCSYVEWCAYIILSVYFWKNNYEESGAEYSWKPLSSCQSRGEMEWKNKVGSRVMKKEYVRRYWGSGSLDQK